MRIIIISIILIFSMTTFGQEMNWEQWEKESESNIRLLPKYGLIEKTKAQKESDEEFIKTIIAQDTTHRKGSDHLIKLGFQYLYHDIKTAMYRFNQAYLLDTTNTDIYSGYGAVYMNLGQYQKAKEQYEQGLKLAPKNANLLSDYGTYYLAEYYLLAPIEENIAFQKLDSAILYMTQSYNLNPKDQNTIYKLSIMYWNKSDCDNAWKFYKECMALGGASVPESYAIGLAKDCNQKNK
ncbi:MAG TPA: tetratricopeptide repeat protein [Edaphocola sp.]|nr:tetratricopeptide repeat protein [Edaphocola sp.]